MTRLNLKLKKKLIQNNHAELINQAIDFIVESRAKNYSKFQLQLVTDADDEFVKAKDLNDLESQMREERLQAFA